MTTIDLDLLLSAYTQGIFPMGKSRSSKIVEWFSAPMRGIIPIDKPHIPQRLRRTLLKSTYTITADRDFAGVIAGCAEPRNGDRDTWINPPIIEAYTELHKRGIAHSVEVWDGEALIGGVYGIALGRAFFGESMFSRKTDASKIALVHLLARLHFHGFELFDTQFLNDHLVQFGAVEIPAEDYSGLLAAALAGAGASFSSMSEPASAGLLTLYLQSTTQTS